MIDVAGRTLTELMADAYKESQLSWGGVTLHWPTHTFLPDGIDAYAVTVKRPGQDTIEVPADCGWDVFSIAFMRACSEFSTDYLGVFHDDDKGTIDLDPVEVVKTTAEVDAIARDHPVIGGAYHFATGNGYWPNNER